MGSGVSGRFLVGFIFRAALFGMTLSASHLAWAGAPRQIIFALAVGVNHSLDATRPPLQYADDDALQYAALMTQLTDRDNVILLTEPDADTRPLLQGTKASSPTLSALQSAAETLNVRMTAATKSGVHPIFYFFYTGHGDVKNNEGYITLNDGRLTREDFLKLLKRSSAEENHVVIDSCKSFFMVFKRGEGGKRKPIEGSFVTEDTTLPRNTGVFLSTSSGAESHEWEAFQAGIFSHEMRSALRGGADLDGNRAVTYEEAAAFIRRANEAIPVRRFRPQFFVHPPGNAPANISVLADLSAASGNWVRLGVGHAEHQFVEDAMGRRLLDVHPAADTDTALLVPTMRPLFVRFPESGKEILVPIGNPVHLGNEPFTSWTVSSRGAEHESFARIFRLPFDRSAVVAYRSSTEAPQARLSDEHPSASAWYRRSLGIASIVLGATGVAMTGLAVSENRNAQNAETGTSIQAANDRIRAYNIAAISCYATAGAALTAFAAWTLREKRQLRLGAGNTPSTLFQFSGSF